MNHALRCAVCLLSVALLSGCDILERIPLTPKDALRSAGKFGLATREKVEETPEGTVYRLTVQSRRSATWLEADMAMWSDLHNSCPQGQLHETLSTQPDESRGTGRGVPHPADTLFVRTVRCAPRLPFEFDIAPGIGEDVAQSDMYQSLAGADLATTQEPMVTMLYANRFAPRYQQMQETLALIVHMRLADCPEGVAIRNLTMGVMPPAPATPGKPRADALLGFTTECVQAPAAPVAGS